MLSILEARKLILFFYSSILLSLLFHFLMSSSFTFLLIPSSSSSPEVEVSLSYSPGSDQEISCLFDYAKNYFSSLSPSSSSSIRSNVRSQIQEMTKSSTVDESLIDLVLSASAVDTIALQVNKKSTNYIGINLLCDDQGVAKQLPVNLRASQLTAIAGKPMKVLGDCFLARFYDDEQTFQRKNFTLEEFHQNSGGWIDQCRRSAEEEKKQKQNGGDEKSRELKELMAKLGQNNANSNSTPCSAGHLNCHNQGTLRCGRCKLISYCSKQCQTEDWKRHKKECKDIEK
jgi:hypothetical protein